MELVAMAAGGHFQQLDRVGTSSSLKAQLPAPAALGSTIAQRPYECFHADGHRNLRQRTLNVKVPHPEISRLRTHACCRCCETC